MCALVALPFALPSGNAAKGRSVLVFTSTPPTTEAPTLQQAAAADTATTVAPAPPTSSPATTQPPATTATTALVCHDSYNPACGTFRWSPAPAPASPVSINVTPSSSTPTAGEQVTFTVTYADPNSPVNTACSTVQSGMGVGSGCSPDYTPCNTRYGPWEPPTKQPSAGTQSYTFQYDTPGTYTFSVSYPAGNPCYNPYATTLNGTATITVRQASSPPGTASSASA